MQNLEVLMLKVKARHGPRQPIPRINKRKILINASSNDSASSSLSTGALLAI
jgi:hypothetical protein